MGVERIRDYELSYWERVGLKHVNMRDHSNDLKTTVTCLAMSTFQEYLLVGMSNGEV